MQLRNYKGGHFIIVLFLNYECTTSDIEIEDRLRLN